MVVKLGVLLKRNIDWGYMRIGCREEYLDLKEKKQHKNRENYIMMSFIICTLYQILLG
jgi:hypothetical protein